MAENMMNSDHKASTKVSRSNHERIFGPDRRDPTEGNEMNSEEFNGLAISADTMYKIDWCGVCERGFCLWCDLGGEDDWREER
jgi:hypothetical protein